MFGIRIVPQIDPYTEKPTGEFVLYQTHTYTGYGIFRVLKRWDQNESENENDRSHSATDQLFRSVAK